MRILHQLQSSAAVHPKEVMEEKLLDGGVLDKGLERVQLLLAVMHVYAAQHEEPTLAVGYLTCLLGVAEHHKVVEGRSHLCRLILLLKNVR